MSRSKTIKNNPRQCVIKFNDNSVPRRPKSKSDMEQLMDYVKRLFIEVKILRSEVRQLKNMLNKA